MNTIFNRIIKLSICSLVFLLPLFFLPFSFEAFEFNKQYLLFFLVSLAFFAWLAKIVLVDKEIRFKRSPLDLFVLAFLFIAILSTIFSVDKNSSLFGFYGRFSDGLIGLLSLGIFYFLITNNVGITQNRPETKQKTETKQNYGTPTPIVSDKGLINTFLWSIFFVVLFSYFSIFGVWARLSNLQFTIGNFQIGLPAVMMQWTFNPVAGSLEGLAVFLSIILVFLIGRILVSKQKGGAINYLLLISALILLLIIDFTAAWMLITLSLVLFTGFILWKRTFKENVNKLLLPISIIILVGAFFFLDTSDLQSLILKFQLPGEQILNQGISWQVAFKGAIENIKSGFLGSGIGTFHYDFAKFKPVEFNQNLLWQIRFDRAGSYIAEILGTMGFLGILSYFALIGLTLIISYFFLQQNRSGIPLLMAFLALLVGQFVYYQNTILAFTFWLVLGLSVVSWQRPITEKTISFKDFPELSLVFSLILIAVGFLILGTYFFAGRFYLADINYKNGIWEGKTQKLEKAANLNPYQPQYKIALSRDYLGKVLSESQKSPEEIDQVALSTNVYLAITYSKGGQIGRDYIKGATELSPNRVVAWETLGMVYRDIQGIATGALEWAIKSFEKAITLESTNPVFHSELGKLLLADKPEEAKKEFEKALELKSNYSDAKIQLALIFEQKGNFQEAISKLKETISQDPFNVEAIFHLGRVYYNDNQTDEAISQFQQAILIFPNHSNSLYSLGLIYQKKGQKEEALKMFERVLELNPGNQDVIAKIEELKK